MQGCLKGLGWMEEMGSESRRRATAAVPVQERWSKTPRCLFLYAMGA